MKVHLYFLLRKPKDEKNTTYIIVPVSRFFKVNVTNNVIFESSVH